MAKKADFNITSLLNPASLESSKKNRLSIHYKKLIPNEDNIYSLDEIEELADAIEDVGLLQDLIVKPINEEDYKVIVGHRRRLAIILLVEIRGLKKFENVSCEVVDKREDETITRLKLHLSNTTSRELTEYDKMNAASELKKLIKEAQDKGIIIKGRVKEIIAQNMKLGPTQVQKYLSIDEKATEEVKDDLKQGNITVKEAYDTTRPVREKKSEGAVEDEHKENELGEEPTIPKASDVKEIMFAIKKFDEFKKASKNIEDKPMETLISLMEIKLGELKNNRFSKTGSLSDPKNKAEPHNKNGVTQ
jgi:ParB family chromosome partitioning protein